MRSKIDHHLLLTSAEDHGVGKSGHARADFDGPSTGVIHDPVVEAPSIDVPCPASDGAVYDRSPEEQEDHERENSTSLGDTSGNNSSGGGTELHLQSHC